MTADDIKYIEELCINAKKASKIAANLKTVEKNNILFKIAKKILDNKDYIISENKKDLKEAEATGIAPAMLDRLLLNEKRIDDIAKSVEDIARFTDPIGRIENMKVVPSGIRVGQMRVPLGVIAAIYEARPNVTVDIAALCIKSGNVSILRGGQEAFNSNMAFGRLITESLKESGVSEYIVNVINRTSRELVPPLLKMDKYIDMVIPRGGEGLIKMVVQESTIPVLRHERGLCHVFVDESANRDFAEKITINAKVQRPTVCNAAETLLIHENYPYKRELIQALIDHNVEIRGCEKTQRLHEKVKAATEVDWDMEYLDLIISVKIVSSLDEALEHIARYSSGHTETIITANYYNSERFLKEVDSAAVMVNASTRFHDGGEFGLGAEVGISTQKLHARGAMGIEGLTTLKYIVYGNGETR
ncbi:MAG TPA: glutamate-5-semialdehyde dehydrogenase [Spirochaetota bacterium]|mgnify:CR=1 FL=1|nr:glutamate-5-semialdehyde dehydrogenase [Spirochaetota bacterium]OQB00511.1 MAG: Gamma-glutamyl phosphate reductase [Spirochaetes bacterium ADurb.Bin218]HON14940.1 glutamate-5-semialdehyde dehydrogenase [Spirochaetota bacterium]HOQ12447.1 glutamate-5-semialdehyde dehydrogenase [Spirochaetota bacterium]HOV08089.1 glutamate-5-semialdehyde dehydrogenase [Spirochaetota bacterium]